MGTRLRALRDGEEGIALVFAIVTMAAIVASVSTVMYFGSEAGHQATRSRSQDIAYQLAMAGINKASADLHAHDASGNPVNAQNSAILPSQASPEVDTYTDLASATTTWYGTFNASTLQWTIVSTGSVANPAGSGPMTRTLTAHINLEYDFSQPLNIQAWNYIYASHTGSACDESLTQSVTLQASLWVEGNLCLSQTASMAPATAPPTPVPPVNLVVKGRVTTSNSSHIGASGSPITSATVVGGCNGHIPCKWNGGGDPVYASSVSSASPSPIALPVPQWDTWYQNASPGPLHPCVTSSGTPPVFENEAVNPTRNNSVPTVFNLTPSSTDYSCQAGGGSGIAWNHTTQTLSIDGAIFIDGSATVTASLARYVGSATLYLSGTFTMSGSKLCGGIRNGNCDFASWDPNTNMLIIVANGNDGSGNSISLNSGAYVQTGLQATNNINIGQSSSFEGPCLGRSVVLGQSVYGHVFPLINVPLGAPGNPNMYADPQAPSDISG
jgi:hypothetical protein